MVQTIKAKSSEELAIMSHDEQDFTVKFSLNRASLVKGSSAGKKNPPVMQGTWDGSLGWKDPLEKGKATHSSILA